MVKNRKKTSKIFQAALFAASVALLVYFCVSGNNLVILLNSLPHLNPFWLACAAGSVVLGWAMDASVLYELVRHACGGGYTFRSAFRTAMVGQYFNAVTPYAVAGQPMQFVVLLHQGVASGIAVSTLVRKFLVYQMSITCYSLLVIVVRYHFFRAKIQGFMALAFIGFLCQSATVVVLLLFTYSPVFTTRLIQGVVWVLTKLHVVRQPEDTRKKVRGQLQFYLDNNRAMKGNRLLSARIYGFTLLQLTAMFLVPFFIYKAFHSQGAPIFDMIAAQSFVTMISSYTPLPGAAGAAEGSFLVIFQLFFKQDVITQAMLLWRLLAYYSCVAVGVFFVGFGGRREELRAGLREVELKKAGGAAGGEGTMQK
ncbi:MAG TPA: hypothetical protein DCL64_04595 [Ruminococcaceae bacterium]|jgi:hypothetical protein|nr:hypothetical protein [Oscillospiraceae bacterium]HBQ46959.1 hypothetical protein [Oscillospiraceae bacterium]